MDTHQDVSTEAITRELPTEDQKKIREKATNHILTAIGLMDPGGSNVKRCREEFEQMDDAAFHAYMLDMRDKKRTLVVYAPNMILNLKMEDLLKAADYVGLKLLERIKMWDAATQRYYTTPCEYLTLLLPIRRLKQYLMDKISVPESDTKLDYFTGQVVKPDKGSAISYVEMQTLISKGLTSSVVEFMNVRGGNIEAYASMKGSLEETGSVSLNGLDMNTRPRSADVARIYLLGMMLENNL